MNHRPASANAMSRIESRLRRIVRAVPPPRFGFRQGHTIGVDEVDADQRADQADPLLDATRWGAAQLQCVSAAKLTAEG